MSRVYFHFGEGETIELLGAERGMLSSRVQDVALGASGIVGSLLPRWNDETAACLYGKFLRGGMSEEQIKNPPERLAENLALGLTSSFRSNEIISWKGQGIDGWCLILNTALAVGSDAICLAAKIHATCEIHGFFEGEDRRWLASIIERGLTEHVFRRTIKFSDGVERSTGWEGLMAQLRKTELHPVVMSFSITDGFPDMPDDWRPELDGDEDEGPRSEAWWALEDRERFSLAFADIRKRSGIHPISPATLRDLRFRHDLSLLDLAAQDTEMIESKLAENAEFIRRDELNGL